MKVGAMTEQEQEQLARIKCTACRAGEPTVTAEEMDRLHPQVANWSVVQKDGIERLERTFRFKDFNEALSFTNRVGRIAEEEGHHPSILTEWGKVTVTWWTHKIKGLHRNDFIMAAKTDNLLASG
jgi:4a-hydroxytetrahydrobiopterin dehydratase